MDRFHVKRIVSSVELDSAPDGHMDYVMQHLKSHLVSEIYRNTSQIHTEYHEEDSPPFGRALHVHLQSLVPNKEFWDTLRSLRTSTQTGDHHTQVSAIEKLLSWLEVYERFQ